MVLIFYALRRELGGLRKRLKDRAPLGAGLRGLRARLGGVEVALVATGIGPDQARESAHRALETLPRPRLIISTGVAGALAPSLKAGDLIVADRLILEGDRSDGLDQIIAAAPDTLQFAQAALKRAGLAFSTGPLLTASRVLATVGAKRAAHLRTGALAVDMESAAIAIEVAGVGVPFVCVRPVMDEADEELPGADLPDAQGNIAPFKAAAFFFKNPGALARVPALLRNLSRATTSLAAAVAALCTSANDSQ